MVNTLPASIGDTGDVGLTPESGRPPGEGNGNSLQYSCLGNPMDRGAWWATVHGGHKESAMTKHARPHARAHTHTHTHTHHVSGKMGYFFPASQGGIFLHSHRTKASILGAHALQTVLLKLSSLPCSRSSVSQPSLPLAHPFCAVRYKDCKR